MTCPKCKSEQPDTSQFCSQCAEPLTEHGKAISRSKHKPLFWFVILGGVLFVLVSVVWQNLSNAEKQQTLQQTTPAFAVHIPQTHTFAITNGAATIAASSYSWYTFTIPPNADSVAVNGRFTATGGSGNDIICYILNEDGFVNFKNGHPSSTYFNSGKMTQGPIGAANLPAGTYYLVLDNRFSLITPKAVQVNATLSYRQ